MKETKQEQPKEQINIMLVLQEINKVLVEHKCTAREILHIAKEVEINATISLTFASIYQNQQAQEKANKKV